MSLLTYELKYGRHLARLRRRRWLTRSRAIPLAIITMRKSIHGFPLLSYMGMGLRYNISELGTKLVTFAILASKRGGLLQSECFVCLEGITPCRGYLSLQELVFQTF